MGSKKGHDFDQNPRRYDLIYSDSTRKGFTKCPECGQKTKVRVFMLAVGIEPDALIMQKHSCRYCVPCELIIVRRMDLEPQMAADLEEVRPEIIGNPYEFIGTLDKKVWNQIEAGKISRDEAFEKIEVFESVDCDECEDELEDIDGLDLIADAFFDGKIPDFEDEVTIPLSSEHRRTLLEVAPQLSDSDLRRRVTVLPMRGDDYELTLEIRELMDLQSSIFAQSDSTSDQAKQERFDELFMQLGEHFPGAKAMLALQSDALLESGKEMDGFPGGLQGPATTTPTTGPVYRLKVSLDGATKIFRRIQICASQTLEDLHRVIYDAFDREEEHLYSFYLMPPGMQFRYGYPKNSVEYACSYAMDPGERGVEDACETTIAELGLQKGSRLKYLFDYGDSWWHRIIVEKIEQEPDDGDYPRIIEKRGDSPPQYPDLDEEY